ncbi:MAG: glutathione S-transferase family protein [Proteobacteria bacterium]|nr:glutathione S-transferase family protein [Pseudomonadota bacterium]MBI3497901.1 glutathione S-transferase family protein [Pseudomonadota bacterium]
MAESPMALVIYGSPRSRTMRVLWMAEELGLRYTHIPYAHDDPALKQPDFLNINPAGAIPAICDGDFPLSESLAINLYLAKRYGAGGTEPLYPSALEGEADAWRWSLWANAHLEPWVQRDVLLSDVRTAIGDRAEPVIRAALATLDRALAERAWLVGGHFTVGDLNVAAVLSPSRSKQLDVARHRHVHDWLTRCYARPAAVAVRQRYAE